MSNSEVLHKHRKKGERRGKKSETNCSSYELILQLVEKSVSITEANKDENVVDIEDEEVVMDKDMDRTTTASKED